MGKIRNFLKKIVGIKPARVKNDKPIVAEESDLDYLTSLQDSEFMEMYTSAPEEIQIQYREFIEDFRTLILSIEYAIKEFDDVNRLIVLPFMWKHNNLKDFLREYNFFNRENQKLTNEEHKIMFTDFVKGWNSVPVELRKVKRIVIGSKDLASPPDVNV